MLLLLEIGKNMRQSGNELPITLVLDNARYQKCKLIEHVVEIFRDHYRIEIELLYLPSYSPHLNLIERYWKFVKKEVLYSKYYATFDEFKSVIHTCITAPNEKQKKRLESLLTWNFQSFRKVNLSSI